jgi:hypothetical protein
MQALLLNTSATASDHWLDYFQQNALEPDLPWNDGTSLSGAERWAVIRSIQQFQLGEGASGARLLRFAHRFCERTGNAGFLAALRLFLKEEQRHSEILRRFLDRERVSCLPRHWVHGIFRWLRGLAGLELCLKVLVTAEILAKPYYAALRDATRSPLLRSICQRILEDESAHLRFQAFAIRQLQQSRLTVLNPLIKTLHAAFLLVTAAVVWVAHRRVFQSAGWTMRQFWAETLREFDLLYRLR